LRVLGDIASSNDSFDEALRLIEASLEIIKELDDQSGVARGLFAMAKVLSLHVCLSVSL
jgi:hypothetical protein